MYQSWEEIFRSKVPPETVVRCDHNRPKGSPHHTFTVFVGTRPIAESGIRELAFKYALDDMRDGQLTVA